MVWNGVMTKQSNMQWNTVIVRRDYTNLKSREKHQSVHISRKKILKFFPLHICVFEHMCTFCEDVQYIYSQNALHHWQTHTLLYPCEYSQWKTEWREWNLFEVDVLTCGTTWICMASSFPPHNKCSTCETETQLLLTGVADTLLTYRWCATMLNPMFKRLSWWIFPSCTCVCVCVWFHSVYDVGLSLFRRLWPCHVCAGSRQTAPKCQAGMFCVTPRWHADTYRTAAVFVLLSSPWQRTYRSPKIPEQYQFAQPAHGEWGIRCTQGVHTHARAHFQRSAVECRGRSENTHTHINTLLEWDPNPELAGVIIPSEENDWKLLTVTFVQTGPWFTSLWLYYLVQKKDGFQACKYDNMAAVKTHWHAWSIFHYLFQYWSGIKRASNKHAAKTSSTVYHLLQAGDNALLISSWHMACCCHKYFKEPHD